MTVDDAWEALDKALEGYEPPCRDDPLFTDDRLSREDQVFCEALCDACRVQDLCDAYAVKAQVTAGFWAGRPRSLKRIQNELTAPGGTR